MALSYDEKWYLATHLGLTVEEVDEMTKKKLNPPSDPQVVAAQESKNPSFFEVLGVFASALFGLFLMYHVIGIVWEYNHIDDLRTKVESVDRENNQQKYDIIALEARAPNPGQVQALEEEIKNLKRSLESTDNMLFKDVRARIRRLEEKVNANAN